MVHQENECISMLSVFISRSIVSTGTLFLLFLSIFFFRFSSFVVLFRVAFVDLVIFAREMRNRDKSREEQPDLKLRVLLAGSSLGNAVIEVTFPLTSDSTQRPCVSPLKKGDTKLKLVPAGFQVHTERNPNSRPQRPSPLKGRKISKARLLSRYPKPHFPADTRTLE